MKVLLCDPDLVWMEQLSEQLIQHGIAVNVVRELEELWCPTEEIQGMLVNAQELKSMLFWGESNGKETVTELSYFSAIQSLCLQGKKVVLILPELDYEAECICLQAGAAECIHKGQPMDLMIQRLLLVFQREIHSQSLCFAGVLLDQQTGQLIFQGDSVNLTSMEQKVLGILFIHGSELAEKSDILLQVWGEQNDQCGQRLDSIILKIRQKLKKFPIGIYTRYGKGYYLESDNRNGQAS